MNILEMLLSAQDGGAVRSLSNRFGLSEQQTVAAVAQLLPALTGGLSAQTRQPGGLESLLGALSGGQHQRYLDNPETLQQDDTVSDGNAILGHILGSKDVSRGVAAHAAQTTGLGEGLLKQMLPVVAAMAMGALSKQTAQSNLRAEGAGAGGGGALDMLAPLLDQNGDGSVGAGDVIGLMGKLFGGR
jgi:hypothetical protein